MKNRKSKKDVQNRINGYLIDPAKRFRNRSKEDEASPRIQEIDDIWKNDKQTPENPEEEGDQA
jgi:hypothetical protein